MLFYTLFVAIIVNTFSHSQTNFCINCKYFMKNGFFTSNQFGRCQKYFKTNDITSEYLVSGEYKTPINDYYYCSTARSDNNMCGIRGKDFKKKYKKNLIQIQKNKDL
jgi:hypothetical protein